MRSVHPPYIVIEHEPPPKAQLAEACFLEENQPHFNPVLILVGQLLLFTFAIFGSGAFWFFLFSWIARLFR